MFSNTTKITFFFIIFFASLIFKTCGQTAKPFALYGSISGKNTGKLYLFYSIKDKRIIDSAEIKGGMFVFKGLIYEATKADLEDNRKRISEGSGNSYSDFYLEPKKMYVSLVNNHFAKAKLDRSKSNADYLLFKNYVNPIFENIFRLQLQVKTDTNTNNLLSDSLAFYNNKAKKLFTVL